MRRAVIAFVVFVGTMLLPGTANAAPHTFDGNCQLTGIVAFRSSMSMAYSFEGSGTCSGIIDGEMAQDTPISVRTAGRVQSFMVPVLGDGAGKLSFTKAKISFPIRIEQLGTVLRVVSACMGCAGAAFGAFEPLSQTQPAPDSNMGPRTAIRIVTQTLSTFTTP